MNVPTLAFPKNPVVAARMVILGALAFRMALAVAIGLGVDETYTVAVSRVLSLSYFDHPPLHQWLAHVSAQLFGEGRFARLPFVVLFAGTSFLLFNLTARLYDGRAAFWAVVSLNLSLFFTISAGSWIVPDGPLMLCLALAAAFLARQLFPLPHEIAATWINWLVIGLAIGLAGLAKYQAVLGALGIALFLVLNARGRKQLMHPAPWIAALLAMLIVLPVVLWNAQNQWVSFQFQGGRTGGESFTPWLVGLSLLAQAGWLAPWVFVPVVVGTWLAKRDDRFWLLIALAAPAILVFTLLPTLGRLGLPHWSMPGWFFLLPLAGVHLAAMSLEKDKPRRWALISASGTAIVLAILASQAATGWMTRLVPAIAKSDPTLDALAWDEVPSALARAGIVLKDTDFLVADGWDTVGRVDLAFKGKPVVIPGTTDPRHYAFLVDQTPLLGRDAIVIAKERREPALRASLADHFTSLGPPIPFTIGRLGLGEVRLVAIRATGFTKPLAWPYGPRTIILKP